MKTPTPLHESTLPPVLHTLGCFFGQNEQNNKPDEAKEVRIETVEKK